MINADFNRLPLTGWYPGHMLKAGRELQNMLRLVDLVVELVDARAPAGSRNPDLEAWLRPRPVLLVAGKADLADPGSFEPWRRHYRASGLDLHFCDCRSTGALRRLEPVWRRMVGRDRDGRGAARVNRAAIRLMVVGVPNVGKSTFINRLVSRRKAAVGPKPGVTRQTQWVSVSSGFELLDTPGVLWPRLDSKEHELKLGLLGCMPEEVLDIELLAEFLWHGLRTSASRPDLSCFDLDTIPSSPERLLEAVGRRHGALRAGGRVDTVQSAGLLLKAFRQGRLGRISLEQPIPMSVESSDKRE